MLVALVDFTVEPEKRAQALQRLMEEAPSVLAMPGCRTFRPYGDPADEAHVGIVHEWQNEEAFTAYIRSDGFAEIGAALRPMMTSPPSSRRYAATPLAVP